MNSSYSEDRSDAAASASPAAHWSKAPDFECIICRRMVAMRYNRPGRCAHIPPICWSCECDYSRGVGKPVGGSFRDRRNVTRGIALANALHDEAARLTWPASWRGDYAA